MPNFTLGYFGLGLVGLPFRRLSMDGERAFPAYPPPHLPIQHKANEPKQL